jgi:uncharacterized protein (TIGR04255 family)
MMCPPYGGWQSFRKTLRRGLEQLANSYPIPDKYLRIERLELRYLNGFDKDFGYTGDYSGFLREDVGIIAMPNANLIKKHAKSPKALQFTSQFLFDVKKPDDSMGIIKAGPGLKEGRKAAVLELTVRRTWPADHVVRLKANAILAWFDIAHTVISDWFQTITSSELKARMGSIHPAEESTE